MWLDELADLVRNLRERIEKHGDRLSKNESATRYALVDPLLRALGWSLEDPGDVIPEYSPVKGYADYGMMAGRTTPRLIIEAKSLGHSPRDGVGQSISYCMSQGIEYFAVTNGQVWEVYEPHQLAALDDKRITSFDLLAPEHETVLKMLWLWRGNFATGKPAQPAERPTREPPTGPPPEKPENGDKWVRFSTFHPPTKTPPPCKIRFRDGTINEVGRWLDLRVGVVEWLQDIGTLGPSSSVAGARGGDLVSPSKEGSGGRPFRDPRVAGRLYVEGHGNALSHVRAARRILDYCREDLAKVHVLPRSS